MEKNDIIIDGSTSTWIMPRTDGELGGTYTGTFKFKTFLSPLEQLQAGREYRELLGSLGAQATDSEGNLAFALVQLKHRVVLAPPFWTSTLQETGMAGNVGDLNIIALVLDAAMRTEDLFKNRIQAEREAILNRAIKVGESLLVQQSKGEE